ncbi:ABC transporter substrate-binding protein [Synechococcus sp. CS-205]|uniref:ABC transporter substrate-binding protein n=1 Tax=Synechococcus sp. CS-205 TaxID=2847984 RepID=UPI0028801FC0|nr:ABC transporter substrate-binding protein [Synechococcus sp. CS-205]
MPALKGLSPLCLLGALLVLLLGCQPHRPGGRLVVATSARVGSVDPVRASTFGATQLLSAVGDPLYRLAADGAVVPALAAELPRVSPDGLTVTIPLRRDVLFHDGTPFDAAAMVFSLERFLEIGTLSYLLNERLAAVRAAGPHLLELRLKRPTTVLPQLLSTINITPVSPRAYRDYGERALSDRFVGTGPYRLSFFSDQQQRLEPFDRYWGTPPRNDGIVLISLGNSTALYGAMRSGEVDVLLSTGLHEDHQQALQQQAGQGELREGQGPALEIGYLTLHTQQPPFNDPNLRQALAHSLDRERISERVSQGLRSPLRNLVPPAVSGAKRQIWPAYAPDKARRLFRQAGYCEGRQMELPLTFRSNIPSDRLMVLTWQAQLARDLGDCIVLQPNGMESTTVYRQLGEGAFPAVMLDWRGAVRDPEAYLFPLLSCSESVGDHCLQGESALSGSFWTAPGLQEDLLRSEGLVGSERLELLQAIERRTAAAAPYLPLWLVTPRAWAQRRLAPPRFDGNGRLLLQDLQLLP